MSLTNLYLAKGKITRGEYRILLTLLNPFAPHITQELWEQLNFKGHLHQAPWPRWDEKKAVQDTVRLAVQVNGKTRAVLVASAKAEEEDLRRDARTLVSAHLEGKEITREIHVPGKVWNIVAK
jgi:leucyl-tRNA synthetase